uniref:Uncharacterized protein AlNc14C200G8658 n=1 Tax=Albugo laibachii Nc14 TaxID=890382 RepID=F0WQI8_9STRA|nr:conserved hypothetical protein [Albugo laibachii Nc14]CCA24168.1 conserved hypothetical protein [Albugo laibachii Nc14]|eukprot:CCA24168.1 conserved hypothetical protein [Albugo laibachii Nc14]
MRTCEHETSQYEILCGVSQITAYCGLVCHTIQGQITMPPPFPPQSPNHRSLWRHFLRVTQQSTRRFNIWLYHNVGGIPDTNEKMKAAIDPVYIDLWQYSFLEHVRIFRFACTMYIKSFEHLKHPSYEIKNVKEEIVSAIKGVQSQAQSNLDFISTEYQKSENVAKNVTHIANTLKSKREILQEELEQSNLIYLFRQAQTQIQDHTSRLNPIETLKENIGTLQNVAEEGKKEAMKMEKKDIVSLKESTQSWIADKLLVAHSVVMAFIDGYRIGKKEEMERKDALLVTFAKETVKEHSHVVKEHLEKLLDAQKSRKESDSKTMSENEEKM